MLTTAPPRGITISWHGKKTASLATAPHAPPGEWLDPACSIPGKPCSSGRSPDSRAGDGSPEQVAFPWPWATVAVNDLLQHAHRCGGSPGLDRGAYGPCLTGFPFHLHGRNGLKAPESEGDKLVPAGSGIKQSRTRLEVRNVITLLFWAVIQPPQLLRNRALPCDDPDSDQQAIATSN